MDLGSSPHTRGARIVGGDRGRLPRIIPAYAGSTPLRPPPSFPPRDHPRIRGEHQTIRKIAAELRGSSPHTRGARALLVRAVRPTGIIPAYAGSTRRVDGGLGAVQDHPRIRGEHKRAFKNARIVVGSSPHTRGAPWRKCSNFRTSRIIPAYAGSTGRRRRRVRSGRDHPRIRGEHQRPQVLDHGLGGSSPHTRGAHLHARSRLPRRGIIPAYAGSTDSGPTDVFAARDHPRIRGEHHHFPLDRRFRGGSSPHTRGALAFGDHVGVSAGIIPAYAGSTSRPRIGFD